MCAHTYTHVHTRTQISKCINNVIFKKVGLEAGKTAQRLKAPAALPKDPSATPSIHVILHSHLYLQFPAIWCPFLASKDTQAQMCYTDNYAGKIRTLIKHSKKQKHKHQKPVALMCASWLLLSSFVPSELWSEGWCYPHSQLGRPTEMLH